jgi:exosortase A-associated hydrolase 1
MHACEQAVSFDSPSGRLYGILHVPQNPSPRGVLIVAGGPAIGRQYRIGSQRQFVLLARRWAGMGIPVMRFDHTGCGDSDGDMTPLEHCGPDIARALDVFGARVVGLCEIVLWGLSNAGSACMSYAPHDPRVHGVVMVNPWVYRESRNAGQLLRYYYPVRLVTPRFWRDLLVAQLDIRTSLRMLLRVLAARSREALARRTPATAKAHPQDVGRPDIMTREHLIARMRSFGGRVLVILSGQDLTALAFRDKVMGTRAWQQMVETGRIARRDLPEANHTFARHEWREQIAQWTLEWMMDWEDNLHEDEAALRPGRGAPCDCPATTGRAVAT